MTDEGRRLVNLAHAQRAYEHRVRSLLAGDGCACHWCGPWIYPDANWVDK